MIYTFLHAAFSVMNFLILARCLLSFFPHDPNHPILRYVYELTEPVLAPCEKLLPESLRYPLDFTPMIALILLQVLYKVLLAALQILF